MQKATAPAGEFTIKSFLNNLTNVHEDSNKVLVLLNQVDAAFHGSHPALDLTKHKEGECPILELASARLYNIQSTLLYVKGFLSRINPLSDLQGVQKESTIELTHQSEPTL